MTDTLTDLQARYDEAVEAGQPFTILAELSAQVRAAALGGVLDAAAAAVRDARIPDPDAAPDAPQEFNDDQMAALIMNLPPATDDQRAYVRELITGLAHMAEDDDDLAGTIADTMSAARRKAELDEAIAEFLIMADENRRVRPLGDESPHLPDGRYLLGDTAYLIARVKVGAVVGMSVRPLDADGNPGPAVGYVRQKREIIGALATDPVTMLRAYGLRFGRCGLDNEELSGTVAPAYGIHAGCLTRA